MKKICSFILPIISLFILSSSTKRIESSASPNGYAFGSITFPQHEARFSNYFLLVSEVDGKVDYKRIKLKNKSSHNGQLNQGKTYIVSFAAKPGNYTIQQIRYRNARDGGPSGDRFTINFILDFSIESEALTYFGEIQIDEYSKDQHSIVSSENELERDLTELKNQNNDISDKRKSTNKYSFRRRL